MYFILETINYYYNSTELKIEAIAELKVEGKHLVFLVDVPGKFQALLSYRCFHV